MIARKSMRRSSKAIHCGSSRNDGGGECGGGFALERGAKAGERLLHSPPGGHVSSVVSIAGGLNGYHRECEQEKDASGMHTNL